MNAPSLILTDPEFHEYANLFPMLHGEALDALREDIRAHGVRDPIIMYQGAILDGRNRFTCARDLGIEPPVVEFEGRDPLAFVISHNLHRRHLTESQRASIAARVANMQHGGRRSEQDANLHLEIPLSERAAVTRNDAARMLNVSPRSVADAKKVHEFAPEEITRAVDDGRISVSLASKVVDLPDEAKADIIAVSPDKMREVARDAIKKAHVSNNSGNNEWYTPAVFIEAARDVMGGIDLDPATSEVANRTVKAGKIFTAEDDGLSQDWPQSRIWMNPPYAQPLMGQFATKYAQAIRGGSEGIVLVNNATETGWFQEMAAECSAICFPKSRIKFLDPQGAPGAPLQGQAIIYSGPNSDAFCAAFEQFGLVVLHG
jgi:phage N-6-adenine-methyltransferase